MKDMNYGIRVSKCEAKEGIKVNYMSGFKTWLTYNWIWVSADHRRLSDWDWKIELIYALLSLLWYQVLDP